MIGGRRSLQGRKPGDRRVRVDRPHAPYFRYTGKGQLTAKEAASVPTTPGGRLIAKIRAIVLGRPLHQDEEIGERLSKTKALAIFSSDAISSSAYATEEVILAFILGGAALAALQWSLPVAMGIAVLLAVVAFSYRQVCIAYPTGGGSYSVSKANFGRLASLVAASALLIDYNLTAAVSTSSAVEQIVSAFPSLGDVRVLIGITALGLITLANLRGVREAGNIFAVPTYLFMFSAFAMIAMGAYRIVVLGEHHAPPPEVVAATAETAGAVSIFLLLRAFASGAVALTGTEAIATGVPAFKPPESKNAATTLLVMGGVLAILFIGVTFLATNFAIYPTVPELFGENVEHKTVIAQVAETVFGSGSIPFYLFQSFTALLLFLAANTSFAAFPRLAAVLGEDGFFPRQFALRGDRLAFSMGIVLLGLIAASLVFIAGGRTHALIPLYAVGVFIDFTISQAGMIRHWLRTRDRGWRYRLVINAIGCSATAIVAVVVTTNSFKDSQLLPDLLEQVDDELSQVSADGAYDSRTCYELIRERKARAAIPPQKRARIWQHGNTKAERHIRDENLREIRRKGRRQWKRESGYHRRSLAETQVFRVKMIFGERVGARSFDGQAAQLLVRCAALNRMTHLGMPASYKVAA